MAELVVGQVGVTIAEGQLRYVSRVANTLMESGLTIYFMDAGSNLRIKNGKLQIRNDTRLGWHSIGVRDTVDGIENFYLGPIES